MLKGKTYSIVTIILLIISSFFTINVSSETLKDSATGNILYVRGTEPGNYSTIQEAINNANNGDTVFVYSGTYYENLIIDKSITLQGEDKNTTFIDGQDDNVIKSYADWINISGLTIQNGNYYGLYLEGNHNRIDNNIIFNNFIGLETYSLDELYSEYNIITNNVISDNIYGASLSRKNIIEENIFLNNGEGLTIGGNENTILNNTFNNDGLIIHPEILDQPNQNTNVIENNIVNNKPLIYIENESNQIFDNNIDAGQIILLNCDNFSIKNQSISNTVAGIQLINTHNSTISDNHIINNSFYGLYILYSNYNKISNNILFNNSGYGIELSYYSKNCIVKENKISMNGNGISIIATDSNIIFNNSIFNNIADGIWLQFSENNNIYYNNISENKECGIFLDIGSDNNTVYGNNIVSNKNSGILIEDAGIWFGPSNNNLIYHNNFIDNPQNAFDDCNNFWNSSCEGNYWNDYSGTDSNGNGIGDTPYNINGGENKDNYPLIEPLDHSSFSGLVENLDTGKIFHKIQDAIDDLETLDSHTLLVSSGTYCENLLISKSIILKGEDKHNTIINGAGEISVFISADNVNISSFTITSSSEYHTALSINSDNNTIFDNNIKNSNIGISLYGSSNNNKIVRNNIEDNSEAISFYYSQSNLITDNIIKNNYLGVSIGFSYDNTIKNNNILQNEGCNIGLSCSLDNKIINNSLKQSNIGINLEGSSYNEINKNEISDNLYAINLCDSFVPSVWYYNSTHNLIIDNMINNNENGIHLSDVSEYNQIYHNNFINNCNQSYDTNTNFWNSSCEGNYWDDYTGTDSNGDEIGDTPYYIPSGNNKDNYPLMGPWDGEINHLPNIPDLPIGPVYGQPTVSYSFTFSTTDPDNDKVSFYVDWGNGETSGWTDLINSGQQIVLWHEWNSEEAYSITVKARDEHGAESIFSEPLIINIEEPTQNNPPNTPNTPSGPTNGEIDITYLFSTNSTDPDNDHIKYGWDWNGDNIADEWTNYFQSGQTCSKSKSWINAGTYQIKVKAKDEHNVESQWSEQLIITIEETTENNPPNTPNTPTGPNTGEVGVTYEFNTSTTDPDNDNVKYGWDWNGDKIVDDWTNLGSDDTLIAITHFWENTGTYNISVKAEDEHENQSSFSSNLTITITEDNSNDPPNQPEIPVGPTTGEIEIDYEYTFTATDQENDNISYYIDWGDGNFSGWTEYQYSGEPINLTHIWSNKGTYNIRVKAKDENESIWSENLTVTISEPSVPKPKLEITIDTGISLKKITTTIKNTGNLQANKVNYTINLKYGIFEREKNPSKEYETLNVSTTQTMEIDELWGIGSIELTATAKAENADTVTYEATGIILGRLVIIFGKL